LILSVGQLPGNILALEVEDDRRHAGSGQFPKERAGGLSLPGAALTDDEHVLVCNGTPPMRVSAFVVRRVAKRFQPVCI